MRLLYVHDKFGALGGAEANILATAEELRRRGWQVGLLHGPRTVKQEAAWEQVFPATFPLASPAGAGAGAPRNYSGSPAAVEAGLTAFQPDLVFLHNLADLSLLEALLRSGLPLVKMVHDHALYCMRASKYNYLTRRVCARPASPFCVFPCGGFLARAQDGPLPVRWVSYAAKAREIKLNRRIRHLVVATQFMKQELLRNGFEPERIEVHAPVPRRLGLPARSSLSSRNLIVYSGQVTRGKGVDVLLQALALVREPFECVVFGDGNFRVHCERLCQKLGLGKRVAFRGFVSPEEIARSYEEASIGLMSSVWPEPFGAAGLEAMQYGLPVVAFDAGGIREWLSDGFNGYLVPWMDRRLYAARVDALLRDKALARALGEAGRQTVAQFFSFDRYVDGLEGLFRRAAARPECEVAGL